MSIVPKLTTVAACRVAGLDRQRFNEYVANGDFECAPKTVPGRARHFDPDAMLALVLFKRLMDDGLAPRSAGSIACQVATASRCAPEAPVIALVHIFVGSSFACPASEAPSPDEWGQKTFSGSVIEKVTNFHVAHLRKLIDYGIEEERSIIGPDDSDA